ncbi:peptidase C39, partial [Escherichia coli]|nr:peptidase C39 [Escherichia coli]
MHSYNTTDYSLNALEIIAELHGISINPEEIRHKFNFNGNRLDITSWLLAAKSIELKAKLVSKDIE